MPWSPEKLDAIAKALKEGTEVPDVTTRELLSWFASSRRGRYVVSEIRRQLKKSGLTTIPDFEFAFIEETLRFVLQAGGSVASDLVSSAPSVDDKPITSALLDPTYRIGKLPSANGPLIRVSPDATIAQAITLMLFHDYSQLPVMQSEYALKGAVSWKSIGRELALGRSRTLVRECLVEADLISFDTSLFSAIPTIVDKEFVLTRDASNRVVGIVTTTDLSLQFRQLAEPFLLLGEIENHLRRLSDGKFKKAELQDAKDPSDSGRSVSELSDLSFGEHIRLLENPARWSVLGLTIDRASFIQHLNSVREVRNAVMHFDPDGVAPEELEQLRNFTRLLAALGAK